MHTIRDFLEERNATEYRTEGFKEKKSIILRWRFNLSITQSFTDQLSA